MDNIDDFHNPKVQWKKPGTIRYMMSPFHKQVKVIGGGD